MRFPSLCLLAAVLVAAVPAAASDYSNLCRSADGVYQMDDEVLSRTREDGTPGPEIPYRKVREIELSHEKGYCIGRSGRHFEHESRSSTVRVAFKDDGRDIEIDMVCEMAGDGMPANEECVRDVITSSTKDGPPSVPPPATSSNRWTHNGSVMRLVATGNKRSFAYESPRAGLKAAGVKRGDVVFDGVRDGQSYSGTAYIFHKGCDPQGYPVTGEVSADERRVTLIGQKPTVSDRCRAERYTDDTLVFELAPE